MAERWSFIVAEGLKELWRMDKETPSGDWMPFIRGRRYIDIGGHKKLAPEEPFFSTEAEGREWLKK